MRPTTSTAAWIADLGRRVIAPLLPGGGRLRSRTAEDPATSAAEVSHSRSQAFEMMKLEYTSLREESAQARNAQQSILQWSFATIGVVFGAAMVWLGDFSKINDRFSYGTFLVVFGAVLPGAAWLSFLAWFGELARMERVGRYLRGFEIAVGTYLAGDDGTAGGYPARPLRWESYLVSRKPGRIGAVKSQVGYLGCLGAYTGVVAVALSVLVMNVWLGDPYWHSAAWRWAFTGYALVAASAYLGTVVILVRTLQRAGAETADLEDRSPGD